MLFWRYMHKEFSGEGFLAGGFSGGQKIHFFCPVQEKNTVTAWHTQSVEISLTGAENQMMFLWNSDEE